MIHRALVAASLAALLALPGVGRATFADDPWEQAARRATDAVEVERKAGDATRLAEALARRAEAYQALGHRSQALVDLEEAAALLDRPNAPLALVAGVGSGGTQALSSWRPGVPAYVQSAARLLALSVAQRQEASSAAT
jgi:hypothetical protein